MIVNNNSYSTIINIPKYPVCDNNVQQDKSEPKPDRVKVPDYNPPKTAHGRLASYKDLLSRSAPLMSDDEFIERAKEQARKDFANNIFQGDEFGSLCRAFVSVVSPDRAGMIENAIKNGSSSPLKRASYLWEILLRLEKGKENALPVSDIGFNPDGSIRCFHITDSAGNIIIGYDSVWGWTDPFTPEEDARAKSLYQIYNDEWKQAKSEITAFEQTPFDLGVGTYNKLA